MTFDPFAGRQLRGITPFIVRGNGPSAADRIERLRAEEASLAERRPGWYAPRPIELIADGLKVSRLRFDVIQHTVTGGTRQDEESRILADLPIEEPPCRVLLVGATGSEARLLAERYLQTIGIAPSSASEITIDDLVLKKVFEQRELIEVVTGVKSKEENLSSNYAGETHIKSLRDVDVRYDSKFDRILHQEWRALRFVPKPARFSFHGLPPTVMLSDSNTVHAWRAWSDDDAILCVREIVAVILNLPRTGVDAESLELASKPPHLQRPLSDFGL